MSELRLRLERSLAAQQRSTEFWMRAYYKNSDFPSVKNLAMSLGKYSGMLKAYTTLFPEDPPQHAQNFAVLCEKLWGEL